MKIDDKSQWYYYVIYYCLFWFTWFTMFAKFTLNWHTLDQTLRHTTKFVFGVVIHSFAFGWSFNWRASCNVTRLKVGGHHKQKLIRFVMRIGANSVCRLFAFISYSNKLMEIHWNCDAFWFVPFGHASSRRIKNIYDSCVYIPKTDLLSKSETWLSHAIKFNFVHIDWISNKEMKRR